MAEAAGPEGPSVPVTEPAAAVVKPEQQGYALIKPQ